MFNSPLEWCPVVKDWVALDEGLAQCAKTKHCGVGYCPLAKLFASAEVRACALGDAASTSERQGGGDALAMGSLPRRG